MNNKGQEFCTQNAQKWVERKKQIRKYLESNGEKNIDEIMNRWFPKYEWSDSQVQERIMRLGQEARIFELDASNVNELEQVAIATLKEDVLKRIERNFEFARA